MVARFILLALALSAPLALASRSINSNDLVAFALAGRSGQNALNFNNLNLDVISRFNNVNAGFFNPAIFQNQAVNLFNGARDLNAGSHLSGGAIDPSLVNALNDPALFGVPLAGGGFFNNGIFLANQLGFFNGFNNVRGNGRVVANNGRRGRAVNARAGRRGGRRGRGDIGEGSQEQAVSLCGSDANLCAAESVDKNNEVRADVMRDIEQKMGEAMQAGGSRDEIKSAVMNDFFSEVPPSFFEELTRKMKTMAKEGLKDQEMTDEKRAAISSDIDNSTAVFKPSYERLNDPDQERERQRTVAEYEKNCGEFGEKDNAFTCITDPEHKYHTHPKNGAGKALVLFCIGGLKAAWAKSEGNLAVFAARLLGRATHEVGHVASAGAGSRTSVSADVSSREPAVSSDQQCFIQDKGGNSPMKDEWEADFQSHVTLRNEILRRLTFKPDDDLSPSEFTRLWLARFCHTTSDGIHPAGVERIQAALDILRQSKEVAEAIGCSTTKPEVRNGQCL